MDMGLDISHDCWHGAYSAFMRWRSHIAAAAGLPPLRMMEGIWEKDPECTIYGSGDGLGSVRDAILERLGQVVYCALPIRWASLKPMPLFELLHHSDCDGFIPAASCGPIADDLQSIVNSGALDGQDLGGHIGDIKEKTQTFIDGLRAASDAKEDVRFS